MISVLAVESIAVIVTNSLVFVLFAKFTDLRRKSNYCLVSLAIADILMALVAFPLTAACNYTQSQTWCVPMDLIQRGLTFSVVFHILLATVDRYIKISNPFRYRTSITTSRITAALIAIWLVSIVIPLAKIPFLHNKREEKKIYHIATVVPFAAIPFVIILILNVHTRWIVTRRAKTTKALGNSAQRTTPKHQRTVLLYLIIATIAFVLGPLLYLIDPLIPYVSDWKAASITMLRFSVHFITPLLYTFFKSDFRSAFRELRSGTTHTNVSSSANTSLHTMSNRSSSGVSHELVNKDSKANESQGKEHEIRMGKV